MLDDFEKWVEEAEAAAKLLEGAAVAEDGVYRTPDGRNFMTVHHYPFKLTVEEFIDEITDLATNQAFIENMRHLKSIPEKRHAEEWIKTYAAWMEMND